MATPGAFLRRDDWPRLLLSIVEQGGGFSGQFFVQPAGDTVPDQARPGVIWRVASAVPGGQDIFGDVTFTWEGNAYGSGAPFTLSFLTPEVTARNCK